MKVPRTPHPWSVDPKRAIAIQRRLADRVVRDGEVLPLNLVAGTDLAFTPDGSACVAGVVVWDVSAGEVVEERIARTPLRFPYVPGLLSFREAPAIIAALRKLRCEPDAFLFDGQGIAHPRRFGLACHVGVILDRPSVGCAKSVLVGTCQEPGPARGCATPLIHDGEQIGMAIRTRDRVKPVYISIGHRVSLDAAAHIAVRCCAGYRLPEPTRLADKLVARVSKV